MPDLTTALFTLAAIPAVAAVLSLAQRSALPTDDHKA